MRIFYLLQTVFFLLYSFWAGYNYIEAHKEAREAKAETASIITHMSLKELSDLSI